MTASSHGNALAIPVPGWIDEVATGFGDFEDDEARMRLAVALASHNVARGGGPFGAAVFSGSRLISAGVNQVLQSGFSIAHAEILALMRFQQVIRREMAPVLPPRSAGSPASGSGAAGALDPSHARQLAPWEGGPEPATPFCLVTSTEPCCQCFGAVVWAGISRLVCGATTADAERIGFDEGPKPEPWPGALVGRGITVVREVLRSEAVAVLEDYAQRGGLIYGRRSVSSPSTTG